MATEIPGVTIQLGADTLTDADRAASIAGVLEAGVIDPDYRFNWEAALVCMSWRQSRDSGTALIIHPTVYTPDYSSGAITAVPNHMTALEWYRFRLNSHREEIARRDRATLYLCSAVLMGYIEGRDVYARQLGRAIAGDGAAHELARASVPSYTEMRNFLMGELDAHPVTAAAAAFGQREFHNRLNRSERAAYYSDPPPETGWL